MIGKPNKQLSFIDGIFFREKKRSRTEEMLKKIDQTVQWSRLVRIIENSNVFKASHRGRPSIPVIYMIKILFLQFLYNLSDPEMEDNLLDRLSFRRFVGMSFEEEVPDFSTIWRFRERLVRAGLDKVLFKEIVNMLDKKEYVLRKGTLIDASIIKAARRPVKEGQETSSQKDHDADMTRRGKNTFYGYKAHVGVDYGSGIIRKAAFSRASVHDSQIFDSLVSGDEMSIFADKAYVDKEKKRAIRQRGIYWGVLDRAVRGHSLSSRQKRRNKQKSHVRNQVERVFAHLKHHYGYRMVRYLNFVRNRLQFYFLCMVYNIKRSLAFAQS